MHKNLKNLFSSPYKKRILFLMKGLSGITLLYLLGLSQHKALWSAPIPSTVFKGLYWMGEFLVTAFGLYAGQKIVRLLLRNHYIVSSLDTMNKPFLITTFQGKIIFYNKAFKEIFPKLEKQGLKAIEQQLADKHSQQVFKKIMQEGVKSEKSPKCEVHIRTKNHRIEKFQFQVYTAPAQKFLIWRLEAALDLKETEIFNGNRFMQSLDLENLFNQAPSGNIILDHEGRVQSINKTFRDHFLQDQSLELGLYFKDFLSDSQQDEVLKIFNKILEGKKLDLPIDFQFRWGMEAAGYVRPFTYPLPEASHLSTTGLYLQVFDNKEQKQIQQRLMQSQKTQAMGQLAGGIAHDFNNLLTAMIGFCDLLLVRYSPSDQSFSDVMQIKQNANRASNLVRQLLAFSRQQTLQPKMTDITEVLADLSILLHRLIGVSISLTIEHGRNLGWVKVDQGQIEQVIINLIVNARDAVKENGSIQVRTSHVKLEQPTQFRGGDTAQAGAYLLLEVIDDGKGIEKQNLPRIFDPFFSTKEFGSGTGLGLSTVYGIVRQTEGFIDVKSTVGKGTKFSIYLPSYPRGSEPFFNTHQQTYKVHRDLTGSETILLVEDEKAVRLFSARALRDKGYQVIEAENGTKALEQIKLAAGGKIDPIDLVITDVVMPEMDGLTLMNHVKKISPHLKAIFISGYAEDSFRAKLDQENTVTFLSKPFNLKNLAEKVKETLEDRPKKASTGARPLGCFRSDF